ncbi:hypothetical protein ACFVTX_00780 [Agromyces sp. NPDC058136]|uniref:hypothetical protein n=1 Tax=Agromyces sp. NPDC058136 TaxID=3346354 RepID=UPI0036D7D0C8
MTTVTPQPRIRVPFPVEVPGLAFTPAAPGLWRVARADGSVLGHVEHRGEGAASRFAARRLTAGTLRSTEIGEFWSAREAAELFR